MSNETLPSDEMANSADEFEALYKANGPLIYRFMLWRTQDRMLAEDLTSSVFEKAWRSRHSFKGGSAKAWLHRIARNTLIDHWRKRNDLTVDNSILEETVSGRTAIDEALDQQILVEELYQAVTKLPRTMRQIVEMRFIDGLSTKQTGRELGLSEANVRVIQYRALCKLRDYLK